MKWAHDMILEQFVEEEPSKYWRQPRQKYVAAATREDLITQAEWDEIEEWMDNV